MNNQIKNKLSEKKNCGSKKVIFNSKKFFDKKIIDVMDKRVWDLPLVEKDSDLFNILIILSGSDHVWVMESKKNKKLLGLITEPNILRTLAPTKRISPFGITSKKSMYIELYETAEHIMELHPLTCSLTTSIKEVLDKMIAYGDFHLAIVQPEYNEILGEVTIHELVRMYYESIKPFCKICETESD